MKSEWTVIGTGRDCPQCLKGTSYLWNRELNRVIEKCKECGRAWEVTRKTIPVMCSCGCNHIEFSEVVNTTWCVVKTKCVCPEGKNITHRLDSAGLAG